MPAPPPPTKEHERLGGLHGDLAAWRRWGPYVAERSWGTVREDYSPDGDAWDYFPHDLARSKAYRWGEDGLAGFCDRYQLLCFALALWNERDPILKERLFGLAHAEGNHGEDVKEYYFYLDATPTHSYMKWLYKYPQREYPYAAAHRGEPPPQRPRPRVRAARHRDLRRRPLLRRLRRVREGGRPRTWWSASPCTTAGPEDAPLHVLPHLWFRNTWAWGRGARAGAGHLRGRAAPEGHLALIGRRPDGASRCATCPSRTAWARGTSMRDAGGRAALHRQRDQRTARVRPRGAQPPALREGRLPSPRRRRRGRRVNPDARGHQGRACTTGCVVPARGSGHPAPAPDDRRRGTTPLAEVDAHRRGAPRPKPTRSTPPSTRRGRQRRREARPAPGLRRAACGRSRSTCST